MTRTTSWRLPRAKSQRKYGNRKPTYDGIKFDSAAEMNRYLVLKDMLKAGEIADLQLQVPYELQPSFKYNGKTIRALKYIADFVYKDKAGVTHIEDVKGMRTKEYEIKRKLMLYKGYEIEEIDGKGRRLNWL